MESESLRTKQVIIIRRDLKMRRGKEIAQGSHASMAAILNIGHHADASINIPTTHPAIRSWLLNRFTKITVTVDSEQELVDIINKVNAEHPEIPSALIVDSGLTEFNGVPTTTCGAIGPFYSDVIDQYTSHLKLY